MISLIEVNDKLVFWKRVFFLEIVEKINKIMKDI
jgi:hypothetical protein